MHLQEYPEVLAIQIPELNYVVGRRGSHYPKIQIKHDDVISLLNQEYELIAIEFSHINDGHKYCRTKIDGSFWDYDDREYCGLIRRAPYKDTIILENAELLVMTKVVRTN